MQGTNPDSKRLTDLSQRVGTAPNEPSFGQYAMLVSAIGIVVCLYGINGLNDAPDGEFWAISEFTPKDKAADGPFRTFLSQLGILYIVAAILERALDVYVKVWRQPVREALQKSIESLSEDMEALRLKGGDTTALDETIRISRIALQRYRARTRQVTILVATAAALVVSAVGPRVLGGVFELSGDYASMQGALFTSLDIFLTAGLVAGGTAVLHPMVTTTTTFFAETASALKERPKAGR
ncbi:hypothetical protein NUH88_03805 [Nisaea acidiphila]|uniref:Uncharacterized protein n=1 Tax=Nisaea acidiphila TaxID=1862145 RepID=A0A9J7AU33_9PROT|nr:hypothetical protein [Nisaea acidiphila]UUX50831.1 hypothetical protein NUH88_03805 [Nisaea acidiphila]